MGQISGNLFTFIAYIEELWKTLKQTRLSIAMGFIVSNIFEHGNGFHWNKHSWVSQRVSFKNVFECRNAFHWNKHIWASQRVSFKHILECRSGFHWNVFEYRHGFHWNISQYPNGFNLSNTFEYRHAFHWNKHIWILQWVSLSTYLSIVMGFI